MFQKCIKSSMKLDTLDASSNWDVTVNIKGLRINNCHWYILHVNMYYKQLTMLIINYKLDMPNNLSYEHFLFICEMI